MIKYLLTILLMYNIPVLAQTGNVGIGITTPGFPLNFASSLGDKISLYGNSGAHYGFGIQSGLLQVHSDAAAANIAFGFGSSVNFTERMRIINSGDIGINLMGRMAMRNGTNPLNLSYGPGIWLYKSDNSAALGFMGVQNNQNLGFYGGPLGWGFTYDAINSRVGIGNNSPNAPLAFPPALGKKITLYPGATGDVGFGVAGNRLQIYSDNPNADVAMGDDAAGTFNERFAVKPTGALAVNGNIGAPGQVLVSNGNAAATWTDRPKALYFTRTGTSAVLSGVDLCLDIESISGQSFYIGSPSIITYQLHLILYGISWPAASDGYIILQFLDANGGVAAASNSQFYVGGLSSLGFTVSGAGDLAAGTYTISAKLVRTAPSHGDVGINRGSGGNASCGNFGLNPGQLVMEIFPK